MNLAWCIQQGVCVPNPIQTQEDCALKADNPTQTIHTLEKQMKNKIILCMYTSPFAPQGPES